MSFFYIFFVGIIIGTAMIIPGVSGGVLAVIFNVYDKLINALSNLIKDFKNSFIFLLTIGSGILLGAMWFGKIMMFLYERHEVITKFSFVGLILGSIPYLFKEVKIKTSSSVNYFAMLVTLLFSLVLWFVTKNVIKIDLDQSVNNVVLSFFYLFLAGIIYSCGKVIPGISGSFLLIMIGMYEYILSVISNPLAITLSDVTKLVPFILGLFTGVTVLLKIMKNLFKKNFRLVYSIIIGFVLGSVPAIIPKINSFYHLLVGIFAMFISFLLSYKLSQK